MPAAGDALTFDDVDRTISDRCEMFRYTRRSLAEDEARAHYFSSTEYLVRNLVSWFDDHGFDPSQSSILDFAGGYGRFARYFVHLFDSVTVSDLEPEMMDFCSSRFGCRTILSTQGDVREVIRERFDVVFVYSMFTHLDKEHWIRWFNDLCTLVAPGGLFIFSSHGYELFAKLLPDQFADPRQQTEEFVFLAGNETEGRLDHNQYGTVITTPDFVLRQIDTRPEMNLVERFGMGELDQYHDINILRRSNRRSLLARLRGR